MPNGIQEKDIEKVVIPEHYYDIEGIKILKHKDEVDEIAEMKDFIQCFIRPELDFFEHKVPILRG